MENRPGDDQEKQLVATKVTKPVWLELNAQYSVGILTLASGFLANVVSGETLIENNVRLTKPLIALLFLLCFLTSVLMWFKCYISCKPKLSRKQKIVLMVLTLLPQAVLMTADAVFLIMIHNSYLPLACILLLGFITPIPILFYHELESDHEDQVVLEQAKESKLKNCFKIALFAVATGVAVQTTEVITCLKKHVCRDEEHPLYSIVVAFLSSMLGSFAISITSSPLKFRSERMSHVLDKMTIAMLLLQGVLAAFVSAQFLDPGKEVYAVVIPSFLMLLVTLCQKSSEQLKVVENEIDPMFGALAGFGIGLILLIPTVFGTEEISSADLITWSVLLLLSAIISSLMKMAFCCSPWTVIEHLSNAIPVVLTLAGVTLLLIEFSYATETRAFAPSPTPCQVLPFPHSF